MSYTYVQISPVILHYVDEGSQFTFAAWSICQPSVIFFADETGRLQVWDVRGKKSEPVQSQCVSGRTINVVAPYEYPEGGVRAGEYADHYVGVADDTGTLHVLVVPDHLKEREQEDVSDVSHPI